MLYYVVQRSTASKSTWFVCSKIRSSSSSASLKCLSFNILLLLLLICSLLFAEFSFPLFRTSLDCSWTMFYFLLYSFTILIIRDIVASLIFYYYFITIYDVILFYRHLTVVLCNHVRVIESFSRTFRLWVYSGRHYNIGFTFFQKLPPVCWILFDNNVLSAQRRVGQLRCVLAVDIT